MIPFGFRLKYLVSLLFLTGLSALSTEEQALLQFASRLSNFDVSCQVRLKADCLHRTLCLLCSSLRSAGSLLGEG